MLVQSLKGESPLAR